jgi:ABC-type lipoprotein export system ATPase subunit
LSLESKYLSPRESQSSDDANAEQPHASSGSGLQTPDSRLTVDGVRKSFASPSGAPVEVLRGASFEAGAGELVAIVGASGAGKSTLLHVCGGLDSADGGTVRAGGFDVTRASSSQLIEWRRREVGFVFQFHHLLPALTAAENVALPLRVARRPRRQATEAARALLEAVGLSERADHLPGELSGGEQQRVAIARALANDPALLLADEPTGNLDARTGEDVGALLARLARERGACVVVATHNERLARLCDRTLTLADGLLDETGAASRR